MSTVIKETRVTLFVSESHKRYHGYDRAWLTVMSCFISMAKQMKIWVTIAPPDGSSATDFNNASFALTCQRPIDGTTVLTSERE
jgi:hypothetical protein